MHVIFAPNKEPFTINFKPNADDCPEDTYIYLDSGKWFVTTHSDFNPKRNMWVPVFAELVPPEYKVKAMLLR